MADGRGGPRQPARPAAVSNPQSGARTDGGAGSKSQPLRVPAGGGFGEAKALTEQQQGAPLAVGTPTPSGGNGAAPAEATPTVAPEQPDLFRPTERPGEPMPAAPTQAPPEDMVLRQLAAAYPSPWLLRMVKASGRTQ